MKRIGNFKPDKLIFLKTRLEKMDTAEKEQRPRMIDFQSRKLHNWLNAMRPYSCNSITEINATYEPCHFLSGRVFYLERESSMQYIYQRRFWTFLGLFSPTVWSRG